jgi:hypothetical protein
VAEPIGTPALRAAIKIGQTVYVLLAGSAAATGSPRPLAAGFSFRDLAAPPALGQPVRVIGDRECQGTLDTAIQLIHQSNWDNEDFDRGIAAPVPECGAVRDPLVAVIHPRGAGLTVVPREEARALLDAARRAVMRRSGQRAGEITEHAYRSQDAIYALVSQSSCAADDEDAVDCVEIEGVVARSVNGRAPEVLIARPLHWPWEEPTDAFFSFAAVCDWNDDGTIELLERMGSNQGAMVRMIAASDHRTGDAVWRAIFTEADGVAVTVSPRAEGGPP